MNAMTKQAQGAVEQHASETILFRRCCVCKKLMTEHDLIASGWRFKFGRSVRRIGYCNYNNRVITISRTLTKLNDYKQIKDTLLHEIAHALVGREFGHGPVWRTKAYWIGCTGERLSRAVIPAPKWQAVCSVCRIVLPGRYFRRRNLIHTYCKGKIIYRRVESVKGATRVL